MDSTRVYGTLNAGSNPATCTGPYELLADRDIDDAINDASIGHKIPSVDQAPT